VSGKGSQEKQLPLSKRGTKGWSGSDKRWVTSLSLPWFTDQEDYDQEVQLPSCHKLQCSFLPLALGKRIKKVFRYGDFLKIQK
jgi:hypothetical protein